MYCNFCGDDLVSSWWFILIICCAPMLKHSGLAIMITIYSSVMYVFTQTFALPIKLGVQINVFETRESSFSSIGNVNQELIS
jgi:hypothetical protein